MVIQKNKGFTLIELLVVIAIIGILSSVVLGSLNTAKAKSADVAIKADLSNIRSQSAIFYDNNGQSFGSDTSTCTGAGSMFLDANIAGAIAHAQTSAGAGAVATCYSDDGSAGVGTAATSWAVSVPFKTNPAQSWCVDSNNVATTGVATLSSHVVSCQ